MNRRGWFLAFGLVCLFPWNSSAQEGKTHDAEHKPCCTPGTEGACCPKDAKLGECCKGKDCCKDKGEHCCHTAAEQTSELLGVGARLSGRPTMVARSR
jgi:hypothetical protein